MMGLSRLKLLLQLLSALLVLQTQGLIVTRPLSALQRHARSTPSSNAVDAVAQLTLTRPPSVDAAALRQDSWQSEALWAPATESRSAQHALDDAAAQAFLSHVDDSLPQATATTATTPPKEPHEALATREGPAVAAGGPRQRRTIIASTRQKSRLLRRAAAAPGESTSDTGGGVLDGSGTVGGVGGRDGGAGGNAVPRASPPPPQPPANPYDVIRRAANLWHAEFGADGRGLNALERALVQNAAAATGTGGGTTTNTNTNANTDAGAGAGAPDVDPPPSPPRLSGAQELRFWLLREAALMEKRISNLYHSRKPKPTAQRDDGMQQQPQQAEEGQQLEQPGKKSQAAAAHALGQQQQQQQQHPPRPMLPGAVRLAAELEPVLAEHDAQRTQYRAPRVPAAAVALRDLRIEYAARYLATGKEALRARMEQLDRLDQATAAADNNINNKNNVGGQGRGSSSMGAEDGWERAPDAVTNRMDDAERAELARFRRLRAAWRDYYYWARTGQLPVDSDAARQAQEAEAQAQAQAATEAEGQRGWDAAARELKRKQRQQQQQQQQQQQATLSAQLKRLEEMQAAREAHRDAYRQFTAQLQRDRARTRALLAAAAEEGGNKQPQQQQQQQFDPAEVARVQKAHQGYTEFRRLDERMRRLRKRIMRDDAKWQKPAAGGGTPGSMRGATGGGATAAAALDARRGLARVETLDELLAELRDVREPGRQHDTKYVRHKNKAEVKWLERGDAPYSETRRYLEGQEAYRRMERLRKRVSKAASKAVPTQHPGDGGVGDDEGMRGGDGAAEVVGVPAVDGGGSTRDEVSQPPTSTVFPSPFAPMQSFPRPLRWASHPQLGHRSQKKCFSVFLYQY
jgi:hypothetical protein